MVDMAFEVLGALFAFLKYPFFLFFGVMGFFGLLCFANCVVLFVKGERPKKRTVNSKYKKIGVLKRLFVLFPLRFAKDFFSKNPDEFPYKGVVIFTGRQGRGKTVALAKFMLDIQAQYPLCKCITNLDYKYQDKALDHWKRLIDYKNGINGVVAAIDETQNWFSSNQSKNFPPEMLSVITQNRKNRRIILGTAQNFYLLSKPLRSQCTEIRECFTILKCVTFVRRREPILDCQGDVKEYKNRGFYFFVHDDKLRNCYDTYKVIENLKHSGFQERSGNDISITVKSDG